MFTKPGLFSVALIAHTLSAQAQVSVLTQHNDNFRDGVNAGETVLTPENVNAGQFGMLFKIPVDDQVFAQPLVVARVAIAGGVHSVVYVATANNSVYAFDAENGTPYWHVNFGPPITKALAGWYCDDILGSSGIMSTPVIANNRLYVVAQTYVNSTSTHSLHALNIATGAEEAGSPVQIQAPEFNSITQMQRPGLLSANGNIYFSVASHCDISPWKGLTFAYNASSLSQVGVFNASPDDNGNGTWQAGNGDAADPAGNIYVVSGNGNWDGATNFGETMLKTSPTLALEDWHTPSDWSNLDLLDSDLTSSGPLLLMNTDYMIAGGKDGVLRLVNTTDMGHLGDDTAQNWTATSSHIHSMNYYGSNLYIWGQSDFLKVFPFNGSTFATSPSFTGNIQAFGHPGGTLSISANGHADGILWATTNSRGDPSDPTLGAWHMTQPGILYAYNLANMVQIWTNEQNPSRDDCGNYAKFTPPTIVNGKVYLPSFGGAPTQSGQVCVYGQLPTGSHLLQNGTYTLASVNSGQFLADPGASQAPSVVMQQQPATSLANQQWVLNNLGKNIITLTNGSSAQALDVTAGSTGPSALIDQYPYKAVPWQQWAVKSVGSGLYEVTSVNSGEALDVAGGSVAANANIDQYPYSAKAWQQWKFAKVGPAGSMIPNGVYVVTSLNSGQALEDPSSSQSANTVIRQYPVTNANNQRWVVNNLGNNVVTLTNVSSRQVLETAGGSSKASALVDQNLNQGGLWQQWAVTSAGTGAYTLISGANGQALDVDGASMNAGAEIDQYPPSGAAWQKWKFTPIN